LKLKTKADIDCRGRC